MFCELHARLAIVGLTTDGSYRLDLTQAELAECAGITAVHINRVLKELREAGLVEFRSGRVTILDMPGLVARADFDSAYLYLERRNR